MPSVEKQDSYTLFNSLYVKPVTQRVAINRTAKFECQGGPKDRQVDWTHNENALPANARSSYDYPHILYIDRIQPQNLGYYICHIRDKEGYTVGHATGFLRVDVCEYFS